MKNVKKLWILAAVVILGLFIVIGYFGSWAWKGLHAANMQHRNLINLEVVLKQTLAASKSDGFLPATSSQKAIRALLAQGAAPAQFLAEADNPEDANPFVWNGTLAGAKLASIKDKDKVFAWFYANDKEVLVAYLSGDVKKRTKEEFWLTDYPNSVKPYEDRTDKTLDDKALEPKDPLAGKLL